MAQAEYTVNEEIANVITHALGVMLAIAGLVALVRLSVGYGDGWKIASSSIYGATLIMLYLASTLYHAFRSERIKYVMKIIDHSAIYLLIAGTYTVFTLVALRGPWGWSLFGIIWSLAIFGIAFKILFVKRFKALSISIYLLMGWMVVVAMPQLMKALPTEGIVWLGIGGILYSLGVVLYVSKRIPFNHAIWHVFVLGGSACHYVSVLYCISPPQSL